MSSVLMIADLTLEPLRALLGKYQLQLRLQVDDEDIQGSFWGASEAGLVGTTVFVRSNANTLAFARGLSPDLYDK